MNRTRGRFFIGVVPALFAAVFSAHAFSPDEAIGKSLAAHPSLRATHFQVGAAEAEREAAWQQFLPTPSVSVEQARAAGGDPNYGGDDTVAVFRLQQPLWTGGRLSAGVDRAEANVAVASAGVRETRLQLSLRAVQAWADWYGAFLRTQALLTSMRTHERLHAQVQRRVDAGASSMAELVLTKGRLDQVVAQHQGALSQQDVARVKLAQLMGEPLPASAVPLQRLNFDPVALPELQHRALALHPAIERLQGQLRMLDAELDERRAELAPELSLRAEHQRGNFSTPESAASSRLFVVLSTRFGAGLSSLSRIEAGRQRREATLAGMEEVQRSVIEQLDADWVQLVSLRTREPALERSLAASRSTAEAWDRQFLAGRKSWMEVMNTARDLAQAEIELSDLKAASALVRWRLALFSLGVEGTLQLVLPIDHE